MSQGKIVQIIGAVVDVEFPREFLPKVYDALKLADVDLTLEVQQQLGDGVVRTIAMGTTDGGVTSGCILCSPSSLHAMLTAPLLSSSVLVGGGLATSSQLKGASLDF